MAAAPNPSSEKTSASEAQQSPSQPSLHDLLQELDQKLRERTRELEGARVRIESAEQAKRNFLGRLEHEIEPLLAKLLNECEKLIQSDTGGLTENQMESLQLIQKAGLGALSGVRNLAGQPIEATDTLTLNAQPASLRTIAEASLRPVRDAALKKNIQLTQSNAATSDRVIVDARLVKQVLVQMLNYTIASIGTGSVIHLDIANQADAPNVEFTVKGREAGPTQASTPAHNETVDPAIGSEFEMAHHIAQLHGGNLLATSEPGQELRLTLTLPWAGTPPAPALPKRRTPTSEELTSTGDSPLSPTADQKSPLVLLADDHPVNLKLFANLLQHLGYRSLVAHTGAEAIKLANTQQPDLILMDIQMPDLDGIEATSQIANAPQTTGIPIICITSFAMPHDRERCFAAGARAYFCKPVNLGQLSKVMADLLKSHAAIAAPPIA